MKRINKIFDYFRNLSKCLFEGNFFCKNFTKCDISGICKPFHFICQQHVLCQQNIVFYEFYKIFYLQIICKMFYYRNFANVCVLKISKTFFFRNFAKYYIFFALAKRFISRILQTILFRGLVSLLKLAKKKCLQF